MKKGILFFIFMVLFSFSLTYFIQYQYEHIEDYETIAFPIKPKVGEKDKKANTRHYKSKNSIAVILTLDKKKWTFFDISEGKLKYKLDWASNKWDLAFQRVKVLTNGGITNSNGKVGVINMGRVDINSIKNAPEKGYIQDARSWGIISNSGIGKWYDYSTRNHHVKPTGDVYVIRTSEGHYAKMTILGYYCNDNKSGCITVEYLYQPDGSLNLESNGPERDFKL